MSHTIRAGMIAVVGRPNVGKSTLINALVGSKVSITTPRPQTTRHAILGVRTADDHQMVFVDTPGIHLNGKRALNLALNRTAEKALEGVDVVLWLIEALKFTDEDEKVLSILKAQPLPVVLGINKIDLVKDKKALLPFIQKISTLHNYAEVLLISALSSQGPDTVSDTLLHYIPEHPFYFHKDDLTNRDKRFRISEIIREKAMHLLQDELPYAVAVVIEKIEVKPFGFDVEGTLWVERDSQKAIVVGKGGSMIKQIGTLARPEIESLLGAKVFLQLWTRVQEDWPDKQSDVRRLGVDD